MSRKVCVVTGTRAEYGLLRPVMESVRVCKGLALQLVVTGMHLSPEFGSTWRVIERDGFAIDEKVEMLLSADTGSGVAKSTALATNQILTSRLVPNFATSYLCPRNDQLETYANRLRDIERAQYDFSGRDSEERWKKEEQNRLTVLVLNFISALICVESHRFDTRHFPITNERK